MDIETQPLRVLIVDDEHIIADSLVLILRAAGHTAEAAYDATDAVRIAETWRPAVLISDVMMPGMNGIELATWFTANQPECKVVLISGNQQILSMAAASIDGGRLYDMLLKPVHPNDLLEFVATCAQSPEPFPAAPSESQAQ